MEWKGREPTLKPWGMQRAEHGPTKNSKMSLVKLSRSRPKKRVVSWKRPFAKEESTHQHQLLSQSQVRKGLKSIFYDKEVFGDLERLT